MLAEIFVRKNFGRTAQQRRAGKSSLKKQLPSMGGTPMPQRLADVDSKADSALTTGAFSPVSCGNGRRR
jgi:hypothetical protein